MTSFYVSFKCAGNEQPAYLVPRYSAYETRTPRASRRPHCVHSKVEFVVSDSMPKSRISRLQVGHIDSDCTEDDASISTVTT